MKINQKIFGSILAFLLLLSGCSTNNTNIITNEEVVPEHMSVNFADMTYERPDIDAIKQKMDDVSEMASDENKQEELFQGYHEIIQMIADFDEMSSLANIHNNIDLSDTFYEEESQLLQNTYTELDNRMNDVTEAIMNSSYKENFVEEMGQDFIDRYEFNKKLNSPEIEDLSKEETALVNEYSKLLTNEYTTEVNGKEVTINDLDFTSMTGFNAYYEIYEKKNAELGGIYKQLVDIRVQIANILGYDSYTDYAYDLLGRDYTKEDALEFEDNVVEYIVPIYQKMNQKYGQKILNIDLSDQSVENGLPYLETALQKEFPAAMQEALAYMKNYGMYKFGDDANMMHAGFTTIIRNAPFMFINTSDYQDPSTLFHEFGHYYNFYLMGDTIWNDSNNLDSAEIHSQGLELLMFAYYEDVYGKDAELMKIDTINSMLESILQGCAEDEFQRKVFENPSMSLEEMNDLHGEIFQKYMGFPMPYEWVDIHHHFETPFYYISYATSAVSSMELWTLENEDRDKALQIYRNMTQNTVNVDYLDALKSSGLQNPFTSSLIKDIAKEVEDQFL